MHFPQLVAMTATLLGQALAHPPSRNDNFVAEVPSTRSYFMIGGGYVDDGAGGHIFRDQMYVEKLAPATGASRDAPIVLIHGQAQTGSVGYLRRPRSVECVPQAERPAPRQLANLADKPILVVTAEASYHMPYDYCTVDFLRQAGCSRTRHVELGDEGIHGNGHMFFMEKNSDVIQRLLEKWISAQ
ncbi:conserved hypothetical protein [Verticillium alfalfae VaMs.102]|uniref:Secreted lipase n=1 Tax=Verticillium alfalfae (strain VaMs.102 / ATCC MYA-4576 / FGSC 10136) TaxID=526221 RepID=C9SKH6_VERA1|nr:conserved hypothetical protein [Verticillium alfalfae VaMs.102]EEY19194.1 conserved hypothetical protein [Verticillium alfalfae VaMs.102]